MTLSDPIADLLTRIRNACMAQHRYVDIKWSKIKQDIAEILKAQGFVDNILVREEQGRGKTMRMFIRYGHGRKAVIQGLKRESKPGCRKYVHCIDIPKVLGGIGFPILSTSKGLMTGEEARQNNVGGELLCTVW